MTIKRQYFTYINNIVVNSDFPGGKYEGPDDFIKIHYGTDVVLENKISHYQDMDSRILACATCDSSILSNGSDTQTVLDFMVTEGLQSFNCKALTNDEALKLAKIFSPARTLPTRDDQGNLSTITFAQYSWDTSTPPKLVQNIS